MRGIVIDGDALLTIRLNRGFTQEHLSLKSDLDVKTIRKAEKSLGKFDLKTVNQLALALSCHPGQIAPALNSLIVAQSTLEFPVTNIDIVLRWHETYLTEDLTTHLQLHAPDIVLEDFSHVNCPSTAVIRGLDDLRQYLVEYFRVVRIVEVRRDDFRIHSDSNYVFLRTSVTIENRLTASSRTLRKYDEFELREGLIAKRISFANEG